MSLCFLVSYSQAVIKAMEQLALEGKIKEKIYGKQKIYFADQVSPPKFNKVKRISYITYP